MGQSSGSGAQNSRKESSAQGLPSQTQNITAYVPQTSGADNNHVMDHTIKRPGFDGESQKKYNARKSSGDFSSSHQQQIITLTVGSPSINQKQKGRPAQAVDPSQIDRSSQETVAERSIIRVAIPTNESNDEYRDQNDISPAATEQNKASVVSQPKISSLNSSSLEARHDRDIPSQ